MVKFCPCLPRRVIVCFLSFLAVLVIFALRTNLSIAIVSMTNKRNITLDNGTTIQEAEFNWNSKEKGYILSAFFYGYAPVQIFGGLLGTKYGGATVLGIGVALTALFTIGMPFAAYNSFYGIIIFRTLAGVFEGISYPCIHSLMSQWAPRAETTRMISFIFSGASIGVVISSPIYGLIAYYFDWRWLFYISGSVTLIWCFFWFITVKDNPQNDSRITEKELKYIERSTGGTNRQMKMREYPWLKMVTSKHVWAIIFSHFADGWGIFMLLTLLPTVLTDIWKFEIKDAGYLSALPFSVTVVFHFSGGIIADYLRKKNMFSTTTIRKIMNSLGTFIPGTVFLLVTYFDSPYVAVALFTIGNGFCTFSTVTLFANYLDIAPQYAGILFGISSTIACTSGIINPIIAGYIVTKKSRYEWRIVFFITAAIYYVAGIVYILFATSKVQQWTTASAHENKIQHNIGNEYELESNEHV